MSKVDIGEIKNMHFATCYAEEQQRDDQSLNLAFTTLHAKLTGDRRHGMIVGQKAWIEYRNAWCAFEGSSDQAPSREVNCRSCLDALTKAQVERLKAALDDPTLVKP